MPAHPAKKASKWTGILEIVADMTPLLHGAPFLQGRITALLDEAGRCPYIGPMFTFDTTATADKPALYADLCAAADAVTAGEADAVANMANVAALLMQFLPDCNWTGFYRMVGTDGKDGADGELVLGPFQGKAACLRIALGRGVCGAAAASGESQLVADVHAFPGHIACDADSRSELVVPIKRDGQVIAVIDLDSPTPARFDAEDQAGVEALAALLSNRV